jgi:serine/threonine protein kinase/WD40 repeat protein
MSDFLDASFDYLPLSAKRRIDGILVRFERAWQQGRPRLEEFVEDLPPDQRQALLTELLHLDIDYRRRAGEQPRAEDYLARFPKEESVVRLLLPPSVKTDTAGDTGRSSSSHGHPLGRTPPEVPGYEMLGELGRGGMGVVYKARHRALNRLVALKFILTGSNAPARHRARFHREAEVVARLRHPNIVQIYDIGEVEGQCYLAFEYVEGGSVRERLDGTPMDPRAAARLLEPVARAVQHAHRLGIIHRDLKPANVLLALTGDSVSPGGTPLPDYHSMATQLSEDPGALPPVAACTPKLTDFGLARILDSHGSLSEYGMAAGTPQYMAPEQATGEPNLGQLVDVWALGATLYELLTGRPPFRAATTAETLRLIRDADPVPPSQLQPSVPRDLETICLKCLEKDPQRRYPGARELADDLQRFCEGEAILARRVSRTARLVKWARRKPLLAALTALLVIAVLAGAGSGTGGVLHVLRSWRETAQAEEEARAGWREEKKRAEQAQAGREQAEKARRQAEERAAGLLLRQAQDYGRRGEADRAAQELIAGLRLVGGAGALERAFRFNLAGWLAHVHALEEILPAPPEPLFVARARGGRVAVAGADGSVRFFDRDGKPIGAEWNQAATPRFLSFDPAGKRALLGSGGKALLRAPDRPEEVIRLPDPVEVVDGALSPDGATAFTSGEDGALRRWKTSGAPAGADLRHPAPARHLAPSPDGRALAVAVGSRPEVWVWDLTASAPTHRVLPQPRPTTALAFHPDGRHLWVGDAEGRVRQVDGRAGGDIGRPITVPGEVNHLALTPDGQRLLTVSAGGMAQLWDVAGRQPSGVFRGATAACLGPEGDHLVVARPGELRVHALARPVSRLLGEGEAEPERRGAVASFAAFPGSKRLLLGEAVAPRAHGLAWPRDVKAGQTLPAPWRHPLATVPLVAVAPGGQAAATVCRQGKRWAVQAWDAEAGSPRFRPVEREGSVEALALAPDGEEIVTGGAAGSLLFWRTATGEPSGGANVEGSIRAVAYSPDGSTLAVGTARERRGAVYVLDRKSGRVSSSSSHEAPVTSLAFDPAGKRLLLGGRVTALLDLAGNRALTPPVRGAAASRLVRQGQILLVGTAAGQVRLFKADDGTELPAVTAPAPIAAVDASADARLLLAATTDGGVYLWELGERPEVLGPALVPGGRVVEARFHGEDRAVFTLTDDGTVRLWPVPRALVGTVADGDRLVQVLTGQQLTPTGQLVRLSAGEWRERRKSLEPDSDLSAGAIAWHDARAHDAWQAGDLFAALWHLDRLLKLQDADRAVLRRRAVVLARLGRGDEAREDHQRAAGRDPRAFARELEYGLSRCQVVGDRAAALWYVEELAKALPKEAWVADERAALEAKPGPR